MLVHAPPPLGVRAKDRPALEVADIVRLGRTRRRVRPRTLPRSRPTIASEFGPPRPAVLAPEQKRNSHNLGRFRVDCRQKFGPARPWGTVPVITHEVGHYIGIAHSREPQAIMAESYCNLDNRCEKGKVAARRLAPDDIAAVCALYPPDGATSSASSAVRYVDVGIRCARTP
ncbi:MAG: hypothetical protein JWP87_875 [Labilithrix sp.]|nr:hypothetical protein [Labilithrix sp.]